MLSYSYMIYNPHINFLKKILGQKLYFITENIKLPLIANIWEAGTTLIMTYP